mgnify:CR=1 FL=1
MDAKFTREMYEESLKKYLTPKGTQFEFDYSEFMCSLRNQYLSGKTFSPKQITAFMNFVRNHEIREIFKSDSFFELNFGQDVKIRTHTYTGVVKSTDIVQFDATIYSVPELKNQISMDVNGIIVSFCSSKNNFMKDCMSLVNKGETITIRGIAKTIDKEGRLILKNVAKS